MKLEKYATPALLKKALPILKFKKIGSLLTSVRWLTRNVLS
ncbi:hypothetical protein B4096_0842 [Heyndrickxia coagulans]|nr:hypothetical protein B4096_0842 [Heyndrickxia coagulans]